MNSFETLKLFLVPGSIFDILKGIILSGGVYTFCLILHIILPTKTQTGYGIYFKNKKPITYRLNGLKILIITIILAFIFRKSLLPLFFFNFAGNLWGANIIGLLISFLYYFLG